MNDILKIITFVSKPVFLFCKKGFLKFKNRNIFFVRDYKDKKQDEFFYVKRLSKDKYGVFNSDNKESVVRIYKKPEHKNSKKLAKQYAKKLAWKRANYIN